MVHNTTKGYLFIYLPTLSLGVLAEGDPCIVRLGLCVKTSISARKFKTLTEERWPVTCERDSGERFQTEEIQSQISNKKNYHFLAAV